MWVTIASERRTVVLAKAFKRGTVPPKTARAPASLRRWRRVLTMYECLSWLTLMLLAQWFFGNLYEAIVFVPNLMPFFESTSQSGEALFKSKKRSPVVYYVPGGLLTMVLAPTLAAISLGEGRAGTAYFMWCEESTSTYSSSRSQTQCLSKFCRISLLRGRGGGGRGRVDPGLHRWAAREARGASPTRSRPPQCCFADCPAGSGRCRGNRRAPGRDR